MKSTYGVVVTEATLDEDLKRIRDGLHGKDADHVVFLSVSPCSVERRTDWFDLRGAFESVAPCVSVQNIRADDLGRFAGQMSVLL